jgi:hypothetical protein
MIVQVAAFGHVPQERQQKRRLLPDRVEIAGRTLLRIASGFRCGNQAVGRYDKYNKQMSRSPHPSLLRIPEESHSTCSAEIKWI